MRTWGYSVGRVDDLMTRPDAHGDLCELSSYTLSPGEPPSELPQWLSRQPLDCVLSYTNMGMWKTPTL